MTDITDVATQLESILSALADVDQSSIADYAPAVATQKIALLIVPFQLSGVMAFSDVGNHLAHAHEVPCEFWVKVNSGDVATATARGHNICLQAMRLLAANPTLNLALTRLGSAYNGTLGRVGRYTIAPRYEEKGVTTWIIATLFVPVEIKEPRP